MCAYPTFNQMPAEVDVTIVVPCRNESRHIRNLLDSLLKQEMGDVQWEAIVADGDSDHATQSILSEYSERYPYFRTVPNPQQIVSTGLNAAIRAARGKIIVRMDCHTEYARDYVKRCLEVMQETSAANVGGPARTRTEGWTAGAIAAAYSHPFSTGGARFHDENYEGYVDTVTYGCWRKQTLEELGLFDENLIRNQDDELNLRMTRRGMTIWQSPSIVSWYRPRGTLTSLFHQYFQYGFWKIPVIRKHRLPGSWRHLVPGFFVIANVAAVLVLLTPLRSELPKWLLTGWLVGLLSYLLAACAASLHAAQRRGWHLLPILPVTFMVFHISYGLGFLAGCCYWPLRPQDRKPSASWFAGLSR